MNFASFRETWGRSIHSGHNFVSIRVTATFIDESNEKNTSSSGIKDFLSYLAETMIEDFDNIAFGQIVTMAVSEHFLHTKPSIDSDEFVKWLPLIANSFAVSRTVIAESGVRATTRSATYMGSSSMG
ncbi:hypothetical protein Tco_1262985 [Tanacetum coccineum]